MSELDKLSTEDIKIVKLLHLSNKEIAEKLRIKERTVKNHLFAIFRRLGTKSRTETLMRFLQLLPPEEALDFLNSQEFINGQGPT